MSVQQRNGLDSLLRGLPLDLGGDVEAEPREFVSRLGYGDLFSVLPPGYPAGVAS